MGYLDDFGGQFPTTDTADARAAGQQAFADAGQWTHAIDDDIFAAPAADQPDTRPLTSRVDLSGTPDVIMEKLQKAKAMAAQAEAAPPKERSFVGKLASAWFRGGERDKLDKVRASVQKLYSENPQDPGAKQAYAAMRAITDIYEQAQAQDPLNAGSKVGQAFLDATYSGPVMAKFALTEGLLIAATDAAAGFLAPATGGTTAAAAAGMTAARLGILGRRLRAARGLVEEGGLVSKAMRMAEPVGKVASVINKGGIARTAAIDFPVAEALFYRQGYAETYDRIIDSTGNPATADAYAKGAGFLSAGIEAAVGPGQLYGLLGGGAANAAAGKFLHRAVDSATKRAIARFGAERVTAFLGEWQEEGAQGGVQSLAVYLATQAQKDPELMGEYLKGVNEQMKDENLVTLAGGATVRNGWDAFATAYESSLRESAPSIAAMASMGIPGSALRERATVRTTKGLESLATKGRTGALLDATGKTPDELRKQTNDEPDYQRALRMAIGGAEETHREIDQEALMVERATRREEAKATDEANAVSLAALHADLKQNDLAIVARADDVPDKDSKDKLNQLKTLLAEVGGGGEEGKKLAESRIAILRQRTQETKAGIAELERLKKEEAAPLPDNPITDQPGNVIHDIARKLLKMASDPSIQLTTDEEGIAQSRGAAVGSRLRRLEAQQNKIKDAELAHKQWLDGKDQTVEGFFSGGPGAKLAEAFKSGESKVTGPALREATRGLNALNKDGKWTETEVERYLEHGTLSAVVVEQKRQAAKVAADQKANDDFFAEAERTRVKAQNDREVKGEIVQIYDDLRPPVPEGTKDDPTRAAFILVSDLMVQDPDTGELVLPKRTEQFLNDKKISLKPTTHISRDAIKQWRDEKKGPVEKVDPTKEAQIKELDVLILEVVTERDKASTSPAQRAKLNTYINSLQKKKATLRNVKPRAKAIPETVEEALQLAAAGEPVIVPGVGTEVFRAMVEGGSSQTLASTFGWRGGIVTEDFVPVIHESGERGMRTGHYVEGGKTFIIVRPLERASDRTAGPVGWKKDERGNPIVLRIPAEGFGPGGEWTPETEPGDKHRAIQQKEEKERTPATSAEQFIAKFKDETGEARVSREVIDRALKFLERTSENTERETIGELLDEIQAIWNDPKLSRWGGERQRLLDEKIGEFDKAMERLLGSTASAAQGRRSLGTLTRSNRRRVKPDGVVVLNETDLTDAARTRNETPLKNRTEPTGAIDRMRRLFEEVSAAQSALKEAEAIEGRWEIHQRVRAGNEWRLELPSDAKVTPATITNKKAAQLKKKVPKSLRNDLVAVDAAIKKSGLLRQRAVKLDDRGRNYDNRPLDRVLEVKLSTGLKKVRQSQLEELRASVQAKIDAIEAPKLDIAGLEKQLKDAQKAASDFIDSNEMREWINEQKVGHRSPYGLARAALRELKQLKFDPSKISVEDTALMVSNVLPKAIPESVRMSVGRAVGGAIADRVREISESGRTADVNDIIDAMMTARDESRSDIEGATKPSITNVVTPEYAKLLASALNDKAIKKLAHQFSGVGEVSAKDIADAFAKAANAVKPSEAENLLEETEDSTDAHLASVEKRKQAAHKWNAARSAGQVKMWSILDQAHRGVQISFDDLKETMGDAAEDLVASVPRDHVDATQETPRWTESQYERNIASEIDDLGPEGRRALEEIGAEVEDAVLRRKLRPSIKRMVENREAATIRRLEANAGGGTNPFMDDKLAEIEEEIEYRLADQIDSIPDDHPLRVAAQKQAAHLIRERYREVDREDLEAAYETGNVREALRSLLIPSKMAEEVTPAKDSPAGDALDVRPFDTAKDIDKQLAKARLLRDKAMTPSQEAAQILRIEELKRQRAAFPLDDVSVAPPKQEDHPQRDNHTQHITEADRLAAAYSAANAEDFRAAANRALDIETEATRQQRAGKATTDGLGERRVRDVLNDLEDRIRAEIKARTEEGLTNPAAVKEAAISLRADGAKGLSAAQRRAAELDKKAGGILKKLKRVAALITSGGAERTAGAIRGEVSVRKLRAMALREQLEPIKQEVEDLLLANREKQNRRSEDSENVAVYERLMDFGLVNRAVGEARLFEAIAAPALEEAEKKIAELEEVLVDYEAAEAASASFKPTTDLLDRGIAIQRELTVLEEDIAERKSMRDALSAVIRRPGSIPSRDDVRRKLLEYAATRALTNNGELLTTATRLRARLARIESGETVPSVPNQAVVDDITERRIRQLADLRAARTAYARATTEDERTAAATAVTRATTEGKRLLHERNLERTPGRSVTRLQETAIGGAVTPRVQNEQVQAIAKLRGVTAQTPDVGVAFDDGMLSVEFTREGPGVTSRVEIGTLGRSRVVINRDASTKQTVSHETLKHIGVATLHNSNLKVLADYLGIKLDKPDAEWIAAAMKENENLTVPQAERLWREEQLVQALDRLDEGEITVPRARAVWAHIKRIIAAIGKMFGKNWNPTDPIRSLRDIQSGAAMQRTLDGEGSWIGGVREQSDQQRSEWDELGLVLRDGSVRVKRVADPSKFIDHEAMFGWQARLAAERFYRMKNGDIAWLGEMPEADVQASVDEHYAKRNLKARHVGFHVPGGGFFEDTRGTGAAGRRNQFEETADGVRTYVTSDPARAARISERVHRKPAMVVREAFQNAVDAAVKLGGNKVQYELDLDKGHFEISDNGAGMTPDEVLTYYLPGFTSGKGVGDIGGLGFAKTALLATPKSVVVVTTAKTEDGTVETTIKIESGQWHAFLAASSVDFKPAAYNEEQTLPGGIRVTVKRADSKAKTGTSYRAEIAVDKMELLDKYDAEGMAFQMADTSRHGVEITQLDKRYTARILRENVIKSRIAAAPVQHEASFPSGTVRISYTDKPGASANRIPLLNRGLYQFDLKIPNEDVLLPDDIAIDIIAKVGVEEGGYPFDLERKSLDGEVKEYVDKVLKDVGKMRQIAHMKRLNKALTSAETIPGTKTKLLDLTTSGAPNVIKLMLRDKALRALAIAHEKAYAIAIARLGQQDAGGFKGSSEAYTGAMAKWSGFAIGTSWHGMRLGKPPAAHRDSSLGVAATEGQFFGGPLSDVKVVRSVHGKATKELMVGNWIGTIIHELAHQLSNAEGETHARAMDSITGTLSYNGAIGEMTAALRDAISDKEFDSVMERWGSYANETQQNTESADTAFSSLVGKDNFAGRRSDGGGSRAQERGRDEASDGAGAEVPGGSEAIVGARRNQFTAPAAKAPAKAAIPFRMGFEKALALVGKTALADWNAAGKPGRYTDWVQQRGAEIQKLSSVTKNKFAEEMIAKVGQGHDLDSTSHLKDTTTPGRYLKNVGNKTRSIWLDTYLPHHRVGMLDPEMGKAHLEKVTAMTRETLNEHNQTMKQLEEIPEAVKKAMGGGVLRSQNSVTISIGGRKLTAKYGTMLYVVNQVLAAKEASSAGSKIAESLGSGGFLLSDTDNPKDALKITSEAEANDMLSQIGLTNPEMLEEARRLNAIFGPNGQGKRVKAAWDKRHAGDKEAQDQFKPRDYYMHIVRDVAQGRAAPGANPSDASVGMSRWSFGRNPERASSMKSLRGAVAPIVAVDAYDILTKTSRDAATFMATADFIRDWTGLLNKDTPEGQKFTEAVRRRFANRAMGDDWVNSMKSDVATIGGIANQSDTLTSFVGRGANSIMASAARSFLSSPWVAMKQLASYSNYATHFGFGVVAKATSSPRMNDPEDFDKVLERTGVIRWRGNDHGRPLSNIFEHRALAGYARQHVGARNFKESWNNLADKGMWFTSEMDKFTARRAIRMAQIMVDKTWSGDKSDAYFQAVADEADRAVIATQVEPTNISRSVLQRNRNPFMMTFTFLRGTRSISASAIMSSAELWIQAQSRYVRALKSGDKAEQESANAERASALRLFSKQMIFQGFLQGAIVEAVNKGKWALLGMLGAGAAQPPEDDDEQKNVLDHMVGFMADSAKQVGDLPPGGFLLARAGDAFGGDEYKRRQSQERLATDVAPVLGFPYDFTRWGQDEQKRRKYEREMSTGQDAEGKQLTNDQMDQRAEWMENRAAKQMVGLAEIVGTWMIGAPLVRDVTQIARKTL